MPAYLMPLPVPRCYCGKRASCVVYNAVNGLVGEYCERHGRQRLLALNEEAKCLADMKAKVARGD